MISQKEASSQVFRRNLKLKETGFLESVSGSGSSEKSALVACDYIRDIINKLEIKSISDCPCGDLHWIKSIDLKDIDYTGYDIVDELITHNKKTFPEKKFIIFDAINEILPKTDLIISRDFLFHLHLNEISAVLDNFKKSGSKYLLTTSFNNLRANKETISEYRWFFRRINLNISPFCLKELQSTRIEFHDRSLNLYKINDP